MKTSSRSSPSHAEGSSRFIEPVESKGIASRRMLWYTPCPFAPSGKSPDVSLINKVRSVVTESHVVLHLDFSSSHSHDQSRIWPSHVISKLEFSLIGGEVTRLRLSRYSSSRVMPTEGVDPMCIRSPDTITVGGVRAFSPAATEAGPYLLSHRPSVLLLPNGSSISKR